MSKALPHVLLQSIFAFLQANDLSPKVTPQVLDILALFLNLVVQHFNLVGLRACGGLYLEVLLKALIVVSKLVNRDLKCGHTIVEASRDFLVVRAEHGLGIPRPPSNVSRTVAIGQGPWAGTEIRPMDRGSARGRKRQRLSKRWPVVFALSECAGWR